MTSVQLVRRAQAGDPQAQADLYESMYKRVYYLALRMTRQAEDAEDATQEAFLAAFRALPNLSDPNAFEGWLFQITANQCRKVLRKNSRLTDLPEDEDGRTMLDDLPDEDEGLIPASAVEKDSERQIILELIEALPEEQRQCVYLFYYAQMSVKQIAETLGCTEGTVKSRLNYARKKLQAAVLATEERDGIRLHSLAPLGLLLLKDCQLSTLGLTIPALGGAGAAAGTTAAASAGGGTAAAGSTAGAAVKTGLLATAKAKIIAGVAAAALVVGGGAAVVANLPAETTAPPSQTETVETGETAEESADTGETAAEPETPEASGPIVFTDPAMEQNFRILLDIPEGPIDSEDMERVVGVCIFDNGMEVELLDDQNPMLAAEPRAGTTAVTSLADLSQLPLPLTIYDYTSDPDLLETLSAVDNLYGLWMCSDTAMAGDVSFVAQLPEMFSLELAVTGGTDLSPVAQCTALRELRIRTDGSVSLNPAGLENLFALSMWSSGGALDLQMSGAMPSIRILSLQGGQLPALGLLANLPGLESLELMGTNLRQLDLNQLSLAPSLRCLNIADTAGGVSERLDLAPLGACPSLEACMYPRAVAENAPEHIAFMEEGAVDRMGQINAEIYQQETGW